jgi:hypothetical protein
MSSKSRVGVVAALVAAFVAWGAAASAKTVTYTTSAVVSGDWEFPGDPANVFTDANLSVTVYGDTANAFTVPGSPGLHFQPFNHATLGSGLGTFDIALTPGMFWEVIFGNYGGVGFADFGHFDPGTVTFYPGLIDSGPGLKGYDGRSTLGPIPVGSAWSNEFDLTNGAIVNIDTTSVHNATFTAYVPEPATWAMLLAGFFGVGATLRARKRLAAA